MIVLKNTILRRWSKINKLKRKNDVKKELLIIDFDMNNIKFLTKK